MSGVAPESGGEEEEEMSGDVIVEEGKQEEVMAECRCCRQTRLKGLHPTGV